MSSYKATKVRTVLSANMNLLSVGDDYLNYLVEDIVSNLSEITSPQSLKPFLEDVANSKHGVQTVCEKIYKALDDEGLFLGLQHEQDKKKNEVEDEEETEEEDKELRHIPASISKVKRVFFKQLQKRRGELEIPETMLKCNHKWHADPFGGPHCKVCDFETKNRTWCCSECNLQLCGFCWSKWTHKML
jgi:hypothetical protein